MQAYAPISPIKTISIIIASGINDRVKLIGKNQFIPTSEYNKNFDSQVEIKERNDLKNLDDALSKFDKSVNNKVIDDSYNHKGYINFKKLENELSKSDK